MTSLVIPNGKTDLAWTHFNLMVLCPVCQNEYQPEMVSFCSVCGWDLTPCPPAFQQRQSLQEAWARQVWEKLQDLEKIAQTDRLKDLSLNREPQEILTSKTLIFTSKTLQELRSERGINYTPLRCLLEARQWREADEETTRLMLLAAKREKVGYLDLYAIRDFPCTDLFTINQLWLEYSRGHFGFSVQKRIWESLANQKQSASEADLGDYLGWRKQGQWLDYDDLIFDLRSPQGHLPVGFAWWVVWWCISLSRVVVYEVFERLKSCKF
ncbi:GUN4 domain-containing protein [Capilliphycus salinus ALCB114379]|uniref:GUN4 domain-containing protein n=1 Tax=Capilliphycus salinus TaxID=2768948 RepID=UPI0039A512AB